MSAVMPPQDKVAVRVITCGVVVIAAFCAVGTFVLIWHGKDPKDIVTIGGTALGAVVGFLARTSTESGQGSSSLPDPPDPPTPVVIASNQQPVPVTPVDSGGGDVPLPPHDSGGDGGGGIVVDGGGDESGGEQPAATRLRTPARRGRAHG